MGEDKVMIGVLVAFLLLIFGCLAGYSAMECSAKTSNIGFPSTYKLVGGCMIEPNPGQWMPLENWRLMGD